MCSTYQKEESRKKEQWRGNSEVDADCDFWGKRTDRKFIKNNMRRSKGDSVDSLMMRESKRTCTAYIIKPHECVCVLFVIWVTRVEWNDEQYENICDYVSLCGYTTLMCASEYKFSIQPLLHSCYKWVYFFFSISLIFFFFFILCFAILLLFGKI